MGERSGRDGGPTPRAPHAGRAPQTAHAARPSRLGAPGAPGSPPRQKGTRPGDGRSGSAGTRSTSPRAPSSRPAPASRGRSAEPTPERPASNGWVRGAILATILVVLAVTLIPTARSVIRQRSDIAALQDKVVDQQASVGELQREQARWADPAYVEQQARERLKFVKVGDRSYSVIDPSSQLPALPSSAVVAAPAADANAPWYGQVWQSMLLADQPSAGMAPVPDK